MATSQIWQKKGKDRDSILKTLEEHHQRDTDWHSGKTWSLVYHASDEHTEFLKKAYSIYFHQNALNPNAFPSLKSYEADIIAACAELFQGSEAAGTMTSGGSESIMMAVKTYRDRARALHPEITEPEIIFPISVHPAFDKAAHYFSVKPIWLPVGTDFKVDPKEVEKRITPNTIAIVGSAPQYPQGVIDPISELAAIASRHGIGMHVDACLGGFLLPFMKKNGHDIPAFDFSVPGVTSISADLHKYGFAAKGASVVLYRDKELRRFQFFVSTEWPGGAFASPSMTGTRPAGSIAAAWATFQAFGEEGYLKLADEIMSNTKRLQDGIKKLGLEIVGQPIASVFAFTSSQIDIYAVADQMQLRGWFIDRQQKPNALHLMVTPAHTPIIDQFLKDLEDSVTIVRSMPSLSNEGYAALYGMMAQIPDRSQISKFLYQFMDERYERQPQGGGVP